ncbi:hypothetical protein MHIR_DE00150 [Candidatus Doolittlea endobia]|uniref:Uncharacterized protein n=1 Tax=Candidatus Doolittlea endobia TaxID=1778262 RepID=A0A143WSI4_9ENTR|nr:hypothetical protein MHIR_DE00150 [Candidatus Doolittlea endobia]
MPAMANEFRQGRCRIKVTTSRVAVHLGYFNTMMYVTSG